MHNCTANKSSDIPPATVTVEYDIVDFCFQTHGYIHVYE